MAKKEAKEMVVVNEPLVGGMVLYAPNVRASLDAPTPESEKERLPGKDFDYVRAGWMRRRMEEAFPMSWDIEFFETANAETLLKAKAIVVKARVSVRHPETRQVLIVKEAFGGATIKLFKAGRKDSDGNDIGGTPVDLGNDYKAAQADAMKKTLSLFGISSDVYEPVVEKREQAREQTEAKQVEAIKEVKKSIAIDPEASITKDVWAFLVQEAAAKEIKVGQLQAFLVEKGWKGEDGKAKPSLIKNKDIPTIEKWIADAPPF